LAILFLGIFLAATLGGGTAIAIEVLDPTVRGSRDIQGLLNTKPIAAIPVVQNSVVRAARRRHALLVTGSFIVLIAIVISVSGLTRLGNLF
jgi:hypothetical protein